MLENTFEKSKKQNPSKRGWDLKKKWDFMGGSHGVQKDKWFWKLKF